MFCVRYGSSISVASPRTVGHRSMRPGRARGVIANDGSTRVSVLLLALQRSCDQPVACTARGASPRLLPCARPGGGAMPLSRRVGSHLCLLSATGSFARVVPRVINDQFATNCALSGIHRRRWVLPFCQIDKRRRLHVQQDMRSQFILL